MSRPSVNPFVVAVFVTVAMLTGNVANNAQAGRSSAKVRSAKQALLKRQQTQKSKGLPQTVRVHRLNATRNNRGKVLVVGRKKGELVQHPTLGPLRVDRVRAANANPKAAEVRIIENTRNIDGTPNQLVVISDTVEYTNEPAEAGDVIRAMTKLGLGLGLELAPTVTKEKASSDNVLRAAKTFAEKHGLVARKSGEFDVFFLDPTNVQHVDYQRPLMTIEISKESLAIEHYGGKRLGGTYSAPDKLARELRATLRRIFPIKVKTASAPNFPGY